MALIELKTDIDRVVVIFDTPVPEDLISESTALVVEHINSDGIGVYGVVKFQHLNFEDGNFIVPTAYPEKIMAMIMPIYGLGKIGFLRNGVAECLEVVRFSPNLLRAAFDPLMLNTKRTQLPKKPGKVAVFTQTYNEGEMLLYWERYYGERVGYENLFVLNNSSEDDSCRQLNPKTSVINMPKAPVDHDHFAQSHGYIQRFLLLKYDWVIKVDTDELLVFEGDLLETVSALEPGTYTPEQGIEVIHDIEKEPRFDFSGKIGTQRKHYVLGTEFLIRPIISSVPTTWTSGNHLSHETCKPLQGCYSLHLKYFDQDFLLSKNKKWSQMVQTEHETTTCRQISDLQALGLQELFDLSCKEINDRLADAPYLIPPWFTSVV